MAQDASSGNHYSQLGEDVVVEHIFRHYLPRPEPGFYIDVGAHHPYRFSNSALLYDRGWHGINIDADPAAFAALEAERARDINIHAGIGYVSQILPFHRFEGSTVNTFDDTAKEALLANGNILTESRMTQVAPLRDLVEQHLRDRTVDYLNVDIEGHDMAALETYDFVAFAPALITIEDQGLNLHDVHRSCVFAFLATRGYSLISHLLITSVYMKTA